MYRTTLLLVKSTNGTDTINSAGRGFVINGKYVATCYHVYKSDSAYIPFEVKVLYNMREKPEKYSGVFEWKDVKIGTGYDDFMYDSVFATLNYKTKKKQYDFKKHVYNNNVETDFIILKLSKKINAMLPSFDTTKVKIDDSFMASGLAFDEFKYKEQLVKIPNFFASDEKVYYISQTHNGGLVYLTYGDIRQGYSGSPLFTKNGAIVGMVQRTVLRKDVADELKHMLKIGIITAKQFDEIFSMVKRNNFAQLGLSINIAFLINKYMKGYY
jgi:hypothetical protein